MWSEPPRIGEVIDIEIKNITPRNCYSLYGLWSAARQRLLMYESTLDFNFSWFCYDNILQFYFLVFVLKMIFFHTLSPY